MSRLPVLNSLTYLLHFLEIAMLVLLFILMYELALHLVDCG
jgi:hypothetical protein